jgi:hypothetical protein
MNAHTTLVWYARYYSAGGFYHGLRFRHSTGPAINPRLTGRFIHQGLSKSDFDFLGSVSDMAKWKWEKTWEFTVL